MHSVYQFRRLKGQFEDLGVDLEDNIAMDLRETGWEIMDLYLLTYLLTYLLVLFVLSGT
jgi:hypothetical protein